MSAAAIEKGPGWRAAMGLRDEIAQRVTVGQDAAGQAWRDMPPRVRVALVMLACDMNGTDPRDFARQTWASYTEAQRLSIGSTAREWQRAMACAGVLR